MEPLLENLTSVSNLLGLDFKTVSDGGVANYSPRYDDFFDLIMRDSKKLSQQDISSNLQRVFDEGSHVANLTKEVSNYIEEVETEILGSQQAENVPVYTGQTHKLGQEASENSSIRFSKESNKDERLINSGKDHLLEAIAKELRILNEIASKCLMNERILNIKLSAGSACTLKSIFEILRDAKQTVSQLNLEIGDRLVFDIVVFIDLLKRRSQSFAVKAITLNGNKFQCNPENTRSSFIAVKKEFPDIYEQVLQNLAKSVANFIFMNSMKDEIKVLTLASDGERELIFEIGQKEGDITSLLLTVYDFLDENLTNGFLEEIKPKLHMRLAFMIRENLIKTVPSSDEDFRDLLMKISNLEKLEEHISEPWLVDGRPIEEWRRYLPYLINNRVRTQILGDFKKNLFSTRMKGENAKAFLLDLINHRNDEATWDWDDDDDQGNNSQIIGNNRKNLAKEVLSIEDYKVTNAVRILLESFRATINLSLSWGSLKNEEYRQVTDDDGISDLQFKLSSMFRLIGYNFAKNSLIESLYFYNNCTFLYHSLNLLGIASQFDLDSFKDYALEQFEAIKERLKNDVMDILLNGHETFLESRFDNYIMEDVSKKIFSIHQISKEILPSTKTRTLIGYLMETVIQRLLLEVTNMEIISEEKSEALSSSFSKLHDLEKIFEAEDNDVPLTALFVPSWMRFQYLIEILSANLADITYLLNIRSLVDFTKEELIRLVRALFADSPKRRECLKLIDTAAS